LITSSAAIVSSFLIGAGAVKVPASLCVRELVGTVPLALGLLAYIIQIFIQRRNEKLQFKLKAAEIAMAARDSSQVAQKAEILKALFPKELKGFEPGEFDPKRFPFSESVERRERLIALLAEYPSSRKEIIRAWALVFPWDARASWGRLTPDERNAYRWFEELQKDDTLNRNRSSDTGQS
jgi:hypothetical protein